MKKIYLLIPFLLLTACVATGVSQPSKFYNLQSADTGAYTNSRIRGNVGVMEITLADYLDKPQIVTTKPNMIELDISENNRWSESLSTMIQRVMADDLAYYLPKAAVKPRTSARENFNYLVQIELNKFDGSWNKNVVLEAWWSIKNASGDRKSTRLNQERFRTSCQAAKDRSFRPARQRIRRLGKGSEPPAFGTGGKNRPQPLKGGGCERETNPAYLYLASQSAYFCL